MFIHLEEDAILAVVKVSIPRNWFNNAAHLAHPFHVFHEVSFAFPGCSCSEDGGPKKDRLSFCGKNHSESSGVGQGREKDVALGNPTAYKEVLYIMSSSIHGFEEMSGTVNR